MVGQRRPEQITKAVRRMLRPGVELMLAEVDELQPERGRVRAGRSWRTTIWSSRWALISRRKPCPGMPTRRTTSSTWMAPRAPGKIWPGLKGAAC